MSITHGHHNAIGVERVIHTLLDLRLIGFGAIDDSMRVGELANHIRELHGILATQVSSGVLDVREGEGSVLRYVHGVRPAVGIRTGRTIRRRRTLVAAQHDVDLLALLPVATGEGLAGFEVR